MASEALREYFDKLRIIHGSSIASDERSYYPALDLLFNSLGATLDLRVPVAAVALPLAPQGEGAGG